MRFLRPGNNASRSLLKDNGSIERSEELFVEAGSWIGAVGEPVAADTCAPTETREASAKPMGQRAHLRLRTCEQRRGDEERPPHDHRTIWHVPVGRASGTISVRECFRTAGKGVNEGESRSNNRNSLLRR